MLLSDISARPAENTPQEDFVAPFSEYRPWVYWFWINGNITREGITADLEAMQRAGIGGTMIMEVTRSEPAGPVAFMSAQWQDMFKFAVQEANRLGLQIVMNNAGGWSGSGGPWVTPENGMQEVTVSETPVAGGVKFDAILPQPQAKSGFYRDIAVLAVPQAVHDPAAPTPTPPPKMKPGRTVTLEHVPGILKRALAWKGVSGSITAPVKPFPADKVIDLTKMMDKDGRLTWTAPEGQWTVMRFGHTFTGSKPQESPPGGSGPECDKLSKAGADASFDGMIKKLAQENGKLTGTTFIGAHMDSWEVGSQNWTEKMPEEFRRLRGYDLTPYLPALTGRVVESQEVTDRFLWDLRKTVSELMADNYTGRLQELCHQNGLKFTMECYNTPADDLDLCANVDEPVSEFWWPGYSMGPTTKAMSSVAHELGRSIVGGEAFTSQRTERWLAWPGNVKAMGDRALCDGVNQIWFHRYTLQPWLQVKPGMEMGLFGVHYDRTQTWWEQTGPWHEYLTRCQYMLRQGKFAADVLFLAPDDPMVRFANYMNTAKALLPGKYDYDVIGTETFIKNAQVKDGRITMPGGTSYRLLVLPDGKTMETATLEKIKSLVEAGAAVLGTPPVATPGLTDYPNADADLQKLVADLWGAPPSADRTVGKGRVLSGMPVTAALEKLGIPPDFVSDKPLHWIHRSLDNEEIYFVASSDPQNVTTTGIFRVTGMKPELWDAETGKIVPLPEYTVQKDSTTVPLKFGPDGAYFVVFREPVDPATEVVSATQDGKMNDGLDLTKGLAWQAGTYDIKTADGKSRSVTVARLPDPQVIEGPWELYFPPNLGAPDKATFDRLISWSDSPVAGIKYFSGTATYKKTFSFPADSLKKGLRVFLSLGDVQVIAQPKLNGQDLGILWHAPYQVDITDAVHAGDNTLEIPVTNLWPNRMIGDEELPPDTERTVDGLATHQWPSWLLAGKTSPTGRITFASYLLWKKGEPLQPSGLMGPVEIRYAQEIR